MENRSENENFSADFIKHLKEAPREYLQNYFSGAPEWVTEALKVVSLQKDVTFIREEDAVDTIYVLTEGIVKAVDYRFLGNSYDYMWYYPVISFGALEVLLELDRYQTTLSTITPCTMLVIPKSIFEKWIRSDISVLRTEVKAMGSFLLEEVKRERVFLFLSGSERLLHTLALLYEQSSGQQTCTLSLTQQDLADTTGLSVKTVARSLKELKSQGYINRTGNRIVITQEQYQRMRDFLTEKHG